MDGTHRVIIDMYDSGVTNGYRSGQWFALTRILDLLNTYETRTISKAQLYRDIMNLRPIEWQDWKKND